MDRNATAKLAAIIALSFAISLAIQARFGAWGNSFTTYPDEASHFVGSVMVRDYLAHPFQSPLAFAREYYRHYPYFAVGYWPPLLYVITAVWMLIAGVGRAQALMIAAAAAACSSGAVAALVRRRFGWMAGLGAALLYLTVPEVQFWLCAVMSDQLVCALCLGAAVMTVRFLERGAARDAVWFSLLSAAAVLTKYSAFFVCPVLLVAIVLTRRWDLLRRRVVRIYPLLIAALVLPWWLWTAHFAFTGLPSEHHRSLAARAWQSVVETNHAMGRGLAAFAALGALAFPLRPANWRREPVVAAIALAGSISFLLISPVDFEGRYLMFAIASLIVVAWYGWGTLFTKAPAAVMTVALGFVAFDLAVARGPEGIAIRPVIASVAADPAWEGKAILAPSDLEGAAIAEFVLADRGRAPHTILRPSKVFSAQNWFGGDYQLYFKTPEEMQSAVDASPVDVILIHDGPEARRAPHEVILRQMIDAYPAKWRSCLTRGEWRVYERVGSKAGSGIISR